MNDFTTYISPELGIVCAMLYVLGTMLKQITLIKDKYIPLILGIVGVFICLLYVSATEGMTASTLFTAVTQGILCAGSAVYVNQLIKQLGK